MILGLDVSTSCTGWCLLEEDGSFVNLGYISLSKERNLFEKALIVKETLSFLHIKYDIDTVFIEENLQAFRPGLSSAKTLLTLARFNGIVGYLSQQEFFCEPVYINVNVARKSVGLKIIRKSKGGAPTKEQVHQWVSKQVNFNWPHEKVKIRSQKRTGDFRNGML